MRRVRTQKPRIRRDHPWHEVLSAGPQDPDVLRAKARILGTKASYVPEETAMYPATSYELARAGAADRRHRAWREARARAARRARATPARPDVTDTRCQALFASTLQRSDAPGAASVAEAVTATVRQFGAEGCASRMAQEFGDHPEAAATRMRWVRSLLT
jgi:hypothetical protein